MINNISVYMNSLHPYKVRKDHLGRIILDMDANGTYARNVRIFLEFFFLFFFFGFYLFVEFQHQDEQLMQNGKLVNSWFGSSVKKEKK